MYLSRIQLHLNQLQPSMLEKWYSRPSYASHQWLWQLFPGADTRPFLFRHEDNGRFFLQSTVPPSSHHPLFTVETKPFRPQLSSGDFFDFQLRANPVVTRNGKRSDVMMDAKLRAKESGAPSDEIRNVQFIAALQWLHRQGERHGFHLLATTQDDFSDWAGEHDSNNQAISGPEIACVQSWHKHQVMRKSLQPPIVYTSVDFVGALRITDPALFEQALYSGVGKSKALGCGMIMVKRRR